MLEDNKQNINGLKIKSFFVLLYMRFAKNFLKTNPINLSHLQSSTEISYLQYKILTCKMSQKGPIRIPHFHSNKQNPQQMLNTIDLLNEIFKKK